MPQRPTPRYLAPYLAAAREHGGSFPTLLWATRHSQRVRFRAITAAVPMRGRSVLDVGCGLGDFYDHLLAERAAPSEYLGIEAVPELADVASACGLRVLRADFVRNPRCLFTGSEVVVISGALTTLSEPQFFRTLQRAYDAAGRCLVFNFLSSPERTGAVYRWYEPAAVELFCRERLGVLPQRYQNYLDGDTTFVLTRPES